MVDKDFRPLSFWSFNEDMQDDEIIKQIHDLKEQGFGGFFMHARAGMTLEYLGDEWMHACRIAIEEAEKLGMYAWLYDENGWPSGFAGGLVPALGEDYTAKHLYFSKEYPGENSYLAAYVKESDKTYKRVCGKEEENADLYCRVGYLGGYADLLSYEAMSKFIEYTHERYFREFGKYFGNVVPGIFTDEPQLVGKFPYTVKYLELFREEYGYDFLDYAWMLNVDNSECSEFKYQASKLVGKLFTENFTGQIENWCREHNIIFTGHYSNEDGLCNQTTANYDLMAQYDIMGRPGIDFLGRRLTSPVLVKQISDATYFAGKNRITSESFGCCGWDVTFNDLLWIADWEAAFGINSIVTHLSAYSMKGRRKRDYPAFFSYQEPWWDIFGKVSNQITESNTFLSEGRRHINIIVVHPTTGMWCNIAGENTYSDESRYISNQFRSLVANLLDLQRDFLIVSEDNLKKFQIKNGKLCFGDIEAGVLMIPDTVSLNSSTWKITDEFLAQNGELIFTNKIPKLCEGLEYIRYQKNGVVLENRTGLIESYFLEKGINDEITISDGYNGKAVEGIILTVKYLEEGSIRVQVMNPSRFDARKVYLKTKGNKIVARTSFDDCGQNIKMDICKSMYDGRDTYTEIMLEPTECVRFVVEDRHSNCENAEAKIDLTQGIEADSYIRYSNKKCVKSSEIIISDITLEEKNALTIDKCDVFVNGKKILTDVLPAGCADDVYSYAYNTGREAFVRLEYHFDADFTKEIPSEFSIVLEDCGIKTIQINGMDVGDRKEGWWIDKSFGKYNANGMIKNGTNIIAMEFDISKHEESDEGEDFEGYRNKFFYSIEPENVYVLGEFDVKACSEKYEDVESIYKQGGFVITDSHEKVYDELTSQGLWFYRGNISYKGSFSVDADNEHTDYFISLKDFKEVAADIIINNVKAGTIYRTPYKLDITSFVRSGDNNIEIIIYGNNRNLLGPHHHQKGNPHMLGVPTFLGKKCFTDFIYPDITDDDVSIKEYAFRKFGLENIFIEEFR